MIDIINNKIKIGAQEEDISGYTVWWAIPGLGLFTDLKEAIEKSAGRPLITTPVALGASRMYEVLPPELEIDIATG